MKTDNNSGVAVVWVTLIASMMMTSPIVATPMMDGEQDNTPHRAEQIGRSTELGISTTSLPLRRDDPAMSPSGYVDVETRQSRVIEPGTLALVGLGLLGFGITRRLRSRRRRD